MKKLTLTLAALLFAPYKMLSMESTSDQYRDFNSSHTHFNLVNKIKHQSIVPILLWEGQATRDVCNEGIISTSTHFPIGRNCKNKNIILAKKIAIGGKLKNKYVLEISNGTGVIHFESLNRVKSLKISPPIDEDDPTFVKQCHPNKQGLYSQLSIQSEKNGCIICDNLQPVVLKNLKSNVSPVSKKYGAPCKNKGLIQLKTLYVLMKTGTLLSQV